MAFCVNCGNKLSDDAVFCSRCGNAVEKDSASNTEKSQKMYEEFVPTLGLGKRFVFTDNTLIFGNEEYEYSLLKPITLVTSATIVTNGVAQTTTEDGLTINLAYNSKDKERFGRALTYANEQINKVQGRTSNYKYLLQSPDGSKVEVYDDYLKLYYIKSKSTKGTDSVNAIGKGFGITGKGLSGKLMGGLGKALDGVGSVATVIGNSTRGGATANIIMFVDLNIQISSNDLIINEYAIPIGSQNMELAEEIIAFVETKLESQKSEPKVSPVEQELWEPIKSKSRKFTLYGKTLEIPQNMDLFNSYRLRFKEIAKKCADKAEADYKLKVTDFVSFIEFFPKIYIENLSPLLQRAVDVFITEGIWNITFEAFYEQHTKDFHLAFDDYAAVAESVILTVQNNQRAVAKISSFIPNMVGGGFGVKGAIKGIAMAETFNAIRNGIENSAIKNAENIHPAQQAELFGRIKTDVLFQRVFADYFNVVLSLVVKLNQNGHDIWWQTIEVDQQGKNIFKNLSNPNFPQDKLLDALIALLQLNPYNSEYFDFVESRFGKSEEVSKIKKYFGYDD